MVRIRDKKWDLKMLHLRDVSFSSWLLKSVVLTFVEFRIMSVIARNLWQQQVLEDTLTINMYRMIKKINITALEICNTELLNTFNFVF